MHRGLEFKPDCVMILFIGNDLQYPNFVAGKDDHLATDRLFLLSGVLGDRSARIPERYQMQVGREGYERALRLIAEVCEEQGITVINCFSPGDRGSVLEDPAAWMEIDAMQRRLGIRLVPFELPWGPEYWVSDDNRHLNAQGTKLLASRVLQELEKQNLIYPEIRQQRSE